MHGVTYCLVTLVSLQDDCFKRRIFIQDDCVKSIGKVQRVVFLMRYEGISKSFEPNMERARNLDLFCFIFQRSPLPTPHTCPI